MRPLSLAFVIAVLCGTSTAADVDQLLKDLKDKDAKKRLKAATDLGEVYDDDKATGALCEATNDPSAKVATAALNALSKVRPDLYKHVATLVLDDSQVKRADAAAALGQMGAKGKPAARALAIVAAAKAAVAGSGSEVN